MKTRPSFLVLLFTNFAALAVPAFAQGDLNPTDPPGHTFKTLTEIEPRRALKGSGAYTISTPGSYYLTENIEVASGNGIAITADNVTLDLNGFTISSTGATTIGAGISIGENLSQIHIFNGHIRGQATYNSETGHFGGVGFLYGIFAHSIASTLRNIRVSGVSVSNCQASGISLHSCIAAEVDHCSVATISGVGIRAENISHSSARVCGSHAIYAGRIASDCFGECVSGDYGLFAPIASNCSGSSIIGRGLVARLAQNCHGESIGWNGLEAICATNCTGESTNGVGLNVVTAESCRGMTTYGPPAIFAYGPVSNCLGANYANAAGIDTVIAYNSYGYSSQGIGIYASRVAVGCVGVSDGVSGKALDCDGTASYCTGENTAGGTAIEAQIGVACVKINGVNNIAQPFLGTVSP